MGEFISTLLVALAAGGLGYSIRDELARLRPQPLSIADLTRAELDVFLERRRQVRREGFSPEHDDEHAPGDLSAAGAAYATHNRVAAVMGAEHRVIDISGRAFWPASWSRRWWKPKDRRYDLVRAAALIIAELERLDRDDAKARPEGSA